MNAEKLRAIAAVIASVLIPVTIAIGGWLIQRAIAAETVRKDFLQIAMSTLSDPAMAKDSNWREWAIAVVDKTAPVPFTAELRSELAEGRVLIPIVAPCPAFPEAPAILMEPPQKWIEPSPGRLTVEDLIDNIQDNFVRAEGNRIRLESMQQLWTDMARIQNPLDQKATTTTEK
jgi:hypothetical protein